MNDTLPWPASLDPQPTLTINIPGEPTGQGSLQLWSTGGASYPKHTVAHRNRVVAELLEEWHQHDAITGPVMVKVQFVFPRPKAHYLPANTRRIQPQLRDGAPTWHTTFPDADKCARLIGDALKVAGVITDDALIARWVIDKKYGDNVGPGSTFLDLYQL